LTPENSFKNGLNVNIEMYLFSTNIDVINNTKLNTTHLGFHYPSQLIQPQLLSLDNNNNNNHNHNSTPQNRKSSLGFLPNFSSENNNPPDNLITSSKTNTNPLTASNRFSSVSIASAAKTYIIEDCYPDPLAINFGDQPRLNSFSSHFDFGQNNNFPTNFSNLSHLSHLNNLNNIEAENSLKRSKSKHKYHQLLQSHRNNPVSQKLQAQYSGIIGYPTHFTKNPSLTRHSRSNSIDSQSGMMDIDLVPNKGNIPTTNIKSSNQSTPSSSYKTNNLLIPTQLVNNNVNPNNTHSIPGSYQQQGSSSQRSIGGGGIFGSLAHSLTHRHGNDIPSSLRPQSLNNSQGGSFVDGLFANRGFLFEDSALFFAEANEAKFMNENNNRIDGQQQQQQQQQFDRINGPDIQFLNNIAPNIPNNTSQSSTRNSYKDHVVTGSGNHTSTVINNNNNNNNNSNTQTAPQKQPPQSPPQYVSPYPTSTQMRSNYLSQLSFILTIHLHYFLWSFSTGFPLYKTSFSKLLNTISNIENKKAMILTDITPNTPLLAPTMSMGSSGGKKKSTQDNNDGSAGRYDVRK